MPQVFIPIVRAKTLRAPAFPQNGSRDIVELADRRILACQMPGLQERWYAGWEEAIAAETKALGNGQVPTALLAEDWPELDAYLTDSLVDLIDAELERLDASRDIIDAWVVGDGDQVEYHLVALSDWQDTRCYEALPVWQGLRTLPQSSPMQQIALVLKAHEVGL